jgi:hypothetical protein
MQMKSSYPFLLELENMIDAKLRDRQAVTPAQVLAKIRRMQETKDLLAKTFNPERQNG